MPGVDGEQNGSNGSTEQLVLPQLGRHAQEDTTPLASMPLHAILPRPQPDKSFNHHKTAHGKKYMSKSRQKPKSIWYLDDIKAKKKNAATSRGKAKGNEWIRQKHTSRSSKHGGKGGKKPKNLSHYLYTLPFEAGLCVGPIDAIGQIYSMPGEKPVIDVEDPEDAWQEFRFWNSKRQM